MTKVNLVHVLPVHAGIFVITHSWPFTCANTANMSRTLWCVGHKQLVCIRKMVRAKRETIANPIQELIHFFKNEKQ